MSNPTGVTDREHQLPHLKELRHKRGYSTRELARASGVGRTSIWRLEMLERCRAETVLRLAAALQVRPEHLTGLGLPPEDLD